MSNALLDFWSDFTPHRKGLNLHPEDRKWLTKQNIDVESHAVENFDGYIRGSRFGLGDDKFHPSLLPSPFHGNITKAKIFILLMNPGFSASDYYAEENPAFRAASLANLLRNKVDRDFPYFSLNPEFAWSGAYQWIESRMRPILQILKRERQCTYYEALAFLSRQIAVIELIPYHSSAGNAFVGWGNPMERSAIGESSEKSCQGVMSVTAETPDYLGSVA